MAVGESPSRIAWRCMRQWLNVQSTRQEHSAAAFGWATRAAGPGASARRLSRGPAVSSKNVLPGNLCRSRHPAGNRDVASIPCLRSATQWLTATVTNQDELKMVKHGL